MKLLLLIALFVCAIQAEWSCNYENNMVIEKGSPPREMTTDEKAQMAVYGQKWNDWAAQFPQYMKGKGKMPTTPVIPCICRRCWSITQCLPLYVISMDYKCDVILIVI